LFGAFNNLFQHLPFIKNNNSFQQSKGKWFFYFYYFISLFFSTANHLRLDKLSYWMVEEWDAIHKCSAPVGAPGCVTQIEHCDIISFSRFSQLIKF